MTRSQIRTLVGQLRPNAPYFTLAFRDSPQKLQSSTSAERLALAYADPAFGLNVPRTYAAAREELPGVQWPEEVFGAYEFLRGTNANDPDLQSVLRFNEPGQEHQRAVLRAGLLCFDITLEELADRLFLKLGVVRAFEILCWNCRDRRHDAIYLARLCRVRGFGYGGVSVGAAESWEARLLRLALDTGSLDQVLAFASSGAIQAPPSIASAELEKTVLSQVLRRLKAGQLSKQDNPWLEPVLASLARRQRECQTSPQEIPGPTVSQSIGFTFPPFG